MWVYILEICCLLWRIAILNRDLFRTIYMRPNFNSYEYVIYITQG